MYYTEISPDHFLDPQGRKFEKHNNGITEMRVNFPFSSYTINTNTRMNGWMISIRASATPMHTPKRSQFGKEQDKLTCLDEMTTPLLPFFSHKGYTRGETHKILQPTHGFGTWIAKGKPLTPMHDITEIVVNCSDQNWQKDHRNEWFAFRKTTLYLSFSISHSFTHGAWR